MAYNTKNPVGSTDPRDLYDNAPIFDKFISGAEPFYPDRFGQLGISLSGMRQDFQNSQDGREAEFDQFLEASAFVFAGDYGAGITLTSRSQYLIRDNLAYRLATSTTIPYTTTGNWVVEQDNFVLFNPDSSFRQEVAASDGATKVGRGSGTVETALVALEERATNLEDEVSEPAGKVSTLSREGRVNRLTNFVTAPYRMTSKVLPSSSYDHFGLMDIDALGRAYLFFRRGSTHMSDEGRIVFTRMNQFGQWDTPQTVISAEGYDYPGNAGGTMPNGRIVIATNSRSIPGQIYRQIEILVSDDYGQTWVKKGEIPLGAYTYKFTYGRGCAVGDKYIMTYYCQIGSGQVEVRTIESTDGGETWQDGVLVASGSNCNETGLCHLGGGIILAVSRIGPGTTGKLRQHLSIDAGATWTNQGDVTPESADGVVTLVSPDISLFISKSGTPHVILTYTDRTAKLCVYRTIPVARAIAGVTGWSQRATVYSAPNSSGYQNTLVTPAGQVIGNIFRETTSNAITQAAQFEIYPGEIPDYESDLTPVSASGSYTLTHGLQRRPKRVEVWFTPDANVTDLLRMTPIVTVISGSPVGCGAQIQVTATGIVIGTGAYVWGTGAFGVIDNSAATRYTAGFYRVRAWI